MSSISVVPKTMTMTEIKAKARTLGISSGKMKKAELIHSIQIAEGCTPCFGRSGGTCPWTECCWRKECFKTKA